MTVVGTGGRKRSGKDVIGDHLVSRHGFVKIGMSDPINDFMLIQNPMTPARVTLLGLRPIREGKRPRLVRHVPYRRYFEDICDGDYTLAKENYEVRRFLQVLGSDIVRRVDNDYWSRVNAERVARLVSEGHKVVVTGIRIPNEIDFIRDAGGSLWWVSRPSHEDTSDTHSTENSVSSSDFDITLVNDATIEDLERKVDDILG